MFAMRRGFLLRQDCAQFHKFRHALRENDSDINIKGVCLGARLVTVGCWIHGMSLCRNNCKWGANLIQEVCVCVCVFYDVTLLI